MMRFTLLCLTLAAVARADEWPAPQVREVFSGSRSYFIRVTPGASWGDTAGFSAADKGVFVIAELFRRDAGGAYRPAAKWRLANPVAPVEFFVAADGSLATLDNWHNVGFGKVAVFYSPE